MRNEARKLTVHLMPHKPRPVEGAQGMQAKQAVKPAVIFSHINEDIRALNASILLLSQKMRYIVRNEKILGRNLLVLNKKLREMEARGGIGAEGAAPAGVRVELDVLSEQLSSVAAQVAQLSAELESIKETYAKASELKEVKFVVDSINPLEFVTYSDVERMIEERMKGAPKSERKK